VLHRASKQALVSHCELGLSHTYIINDSVFSPAYTSHAMYVYIFKVGKCLVTNFKAVGHHLATKVFIGKLQDSRRVWVIIVG
jgi:hypothetical protein